MFDKKEEKIPVFMFNYVTICDEKCVAFSISNGKVYANWYDENGVNKVYDNVPATQSVWQSLEEECEKLDVFHWKHSLIHSHFAFSLDTSVFNAYGFFPSGKSFKANNFCTLPKNFEESLAIFKEFFAKIEQQ